MNKSQHIYVAQQSSMFEDTEKPRSWRVFFISFLTWTVQQSITKLKLSISSSFFCFLLLINSLMY